MRVATKRWGEVTIRKQGEKKNKFDKSKSFSIVDAEYKYSINDLKDIFEIIVYLTSKFEYDQLKKILESIYDEEK